MAAVAPAPRWLVGRGREDEARIALTWGPVMWVLLAELLPLAIRGAAMGAAICLHWFANLVVAQSFPPLLDGFGPGPVFLGYAAIGVLAFVFVSAFITETKGRSLEDLEGEMQTA